MKETLVALLILALSGQEQGDDEPPVEALRFVRVMRMHVTIDDKSCEISFAITARAAPAANGRVARIVNFDMNATTLDRENFDRWVFCDRNSETETKDHHIQEGNRHELR
jgi:predicted transposase YbfD/YdcC